MTAQTMTPDLGLSVGATTSGSEAPRHVALPRWVGASLCLVSFTFASSVSWGDAGASTYVPIHQSLAEVQGEHLNTGEQVSALKEESGITWGQIADLFGVSRRAVHFWVEGGNIAAHNVARLQRLQEAVASLGEATPTDVKRALFTLDKQRSTPYARLINEVNLPGPSLLKEPPAAATRPPLAIAPSTPVGSVDIPGPRQSRE